MCDRFQFLHRAAVELVKPFSFTAFAWYVSNEPLDLADVFDQADLALFMERSAEVCFVAYNDPAIVVDHFIVPVYVAFRLCVEAAIELLYRKLNRTAYDGVPHQQMLITPCTTAAPIAKAAVAPNAQDMVVMVALRMIFLMAGNI